MADNVTLSSGNNSTPATGTVFSTDDVSGAHVQRVKLVDGTADSATVIPGDANGLYGQGGIAHDVADSGNPNKIGLKAIAQDGTDPGSVAENDREDAYGDLNGRQYVNIAHPNLWDISADYAVAQTNVEVKATPGASLKLYITDVIISNGATAGNITLLDGSGGTVKLEFYPAINSVLVSNFTTPIALTANTALALTSTTVTTHSVTINGYIAP